MLMIGIERIIIKYLIGILQYLEPFQDLFKITTRRSIIRSETKHTESLLFTKSMPYLSTTATAPTSTSIQTAHTISEKKLAALIDAFLSRIAKIKIKIMFEVIRASGFTIFVRFDAAENVKYIAHTIYLTMLLLRSGRKTSMNFRTIMT